MTHKLSVIVPVYNSEGSLPELIRRLGQVLPAIAEPFEVLLVNDGSRDRSWDIICELAAKLDWVHGINLMRNYGQHNALLCGIQAARNEIIVTLDDDLQHPPEAIPKLLEKLAEGYDAVYAAPEKGPHGPWRNLASKLTKLALRGAMDADVARHVSAFRAFRAQALKACIHCRDPHISIDVLLAWGTKRFSAIDVPHHSRRIGRSNYTLLKLTVHAFNMLTGFSTWPLRLASAIGFAMTLFGAGVLAYVLGRYWIEGGSVPGFPFLGSVIAIFSGAQMFALGIIGEYLARMYSRTMDRPIYMIRGTVNIDESMEPLSQHR